MQPKLTFLDRYLTMWIFLAMVTGVGIGYIFPDIPVLANRMQLGTTNVPLAVGLIIMMYPPLAKVDYMLIPKAFRDIKVMSVSLILNWIVGPVLMFLLAVIFLQNQPEYMVGLILIGLARCIAMVIVWNDLAHGNREYAALLVALNSLFQVVAYSFFVWLFINYLPEKLGFTGYDVHVSMLDVAESVLIYLGIPFVLGFSSRYLLIKYKGLSWYNRHFIPFISPWTLYALLFTIIFMFSLKGHQMVELPLDVISVAIPMFVYFMLMFFLSFFINLFLKVPYDKNAAISFTATGNNFELAIAVSIAVFGIQSPEAFVGVIGPLIEVPVLILLVRAAKILKRKYYSTTPIGSN